MGNNNIKYTFTIFIKTKVGKIVAKRKNNPDLFPPLRKETFRGIKIILKSPQTANQYINQDIINTLTEFYQKVALLFCYNSFMTNLKIEITVERPNPYERL